MNFLFSLFTNFIACWSGKENMHRSILNTNDQSSRQRVKFSRQLLLGCAAGGLFGERGKKLRKSAWSLEKNRAETTGNLSPNKPPAKPAYLPLQTQGRQRVRMMKTSNLCLFCTLDNVLYFIIARSTNPKHSPHLKTCLNSTPVLWV